MSDQTVAARAKPRAAPSLLRRFRRDENGTSAVEFAIISVPFVTLLLGIMSVCMYFFTMLETENAVMAASRDLRVGNVQQNNGAYAGLSGDPLKNAFKEAICQRVSNYGECMTRMRVQIQTPSKFATMTEPACKDGSNNLIDNATANANWTPGGASSIVLVTACYSWELGGKLPFLSIGNLADGSFLVQSSFALRTEPYN